MTILDHRILIPKSPEKIWEFLSDLSQNSAWQVDCKSVSLLTTKHTGAGVRWRYTTTGGRSYVAEITAWYDGLGYEYTFVDGAPFRESKGRIRLQEIAEGTVVQWTLTYETSGMLAGVRNAVGLKRQLEGAMIDSLKNLWKVLQKVMPEDKPREVKSLMRDAPDYESRTQYRPRHQPIKPEIVSDAAEPSFVSSIVEPPISADDTRPRAPVTVDSPAAASEYTASKTTMPVDNPDTGRVEPVVYPILSVKLDDARDFIPRQPVENPTLDLSDTARRATQEIQQIVVPSEPDASVEVPEPTPENPDEIIPPLEAKLSTVESSSAVPDTVKMATGEMSVFELFGLPRPSQTQEVSRVIIPEPVASVIAAPITISLQPRIGLRLVMRRKRVSIRRPT